MCCSSNKCGFTCMSQTSVLLHDTKHQTYYIIAMELCGEFTIVQKLKKSGMCNVCTLLAFDIASLRPCLARIVKH